MTGSTCTETVVEVTSLAVTPSPMSTGARPVPRRRFQRGSLVEKSGRWYGVYRWDVLKADGTFKREQRWQPLELVSEQSQRAAWRQFQPYLDRANEAAVKLPRKAGLTLAEFVEEWRISVAVNLKGSTTRAAESHLRAHITPKLGAVKTDSGTSTGISSHCRQSPIRGRISSK